MAKVEGQTVKVGDVVCFKSDHEQSGKIVKINGNQLTLEKGDNGFSGDYIGGQNRTVVDADRCWID